MSPCCDDARKYGELPASICVNVYAQVRSIDDVLSLGQQLQVKLMGHDAKGKLQVSHKALTASPAGPDEDLSPADRLPFARQPADRQTRSQRPKPRIPQGA